MKRCPWSEGNDLAIEYHDREWGVASRDDRYLFEMLILEGAQAGLSWNTILAKRAEYQRVYANFDIAKVARFDRRKRERLLKNPGIVRNRLKVESSVTNARAFRKVQAEFGSFADFIWKFVEGRPIQNGWRSLREVPAQTPESKAMSAALKRRDFRFVGPTICYAFMQAVGMVNDHEVGCFRHRQLAKLPRADRAAR
ncbi:MAG: DNA-3-methyladenine glycosylase I [Deltaproteobacteria bacterium]|nr:DNA-3-methyladenine glycosylase I [Deltaproteobacteria bacterium]